MEEFKSFGRRKGRRFGQQQNTYWRDILPKVSVPLELGYDGHKSIDPRLWFDNPGQPLNLEIGFGGGEYLYERICRYSHHNFIGAEPFQNGVVKFLGKLALENSANTDHRNIRIYQDDVRFLLRSFSGRCLSRVDILFPDPWPKKRHHRRRLINDSLIKQLMGLMLPKGKLCIATDHLGYLEAILDVMQRFSSHGFMYQSVASKSDFWEWQVKSARDWKDPFEGIATRYAQKALVQGRSCYYLEYQYHGE